ncbi:hypothetical protein [Corynebacterium pelargi]|uniref:Uncharacterized protein n=1 Tax=Corynebacterium pelargi TaxID=1471400 RepID=A0A410WB01_9CORY|nr:hypothetical protein [Corynebacterium pelargi]QAU53106.1 hypothetical protein CPELA_09255 [Corynebacterium pelargi]GGG74839.1 hypothetical protein GCM10007338_10320 [Corynebacterium pelargi]
MQVDKPTPRKPWLWAIVLVVSIAALMALPNVLSNALPPVHETVEKEELKLGDPSDGEWNIPVSGVVCQEVPLKLIKTYDCGGDEVATSVIETTDNPDLALQRLTRAVANSDLPTETPHQTGNVRVITLDSEQAKNIGKYGLSEGQQITGASLTRKDQTIVAIVTGSPQMGHQIVQTLEKASAQ